MSKGTYCGVEVAEINAYFENLSEEEEEIAFSTDTKNKRGHDDNDDDDLANPRKKRSMSEQTSPPSTAAATPKESVPSWFETLVQFAAFRYVCECGESEDPPTKTTSMTATTAKERNCLWEEFLRVVTAKKKKESDNADD